MKNWKTSTQILSQKLTTLKSLTIVIALLSGCSTTQSQRQTIPKLQISEPCIKRTEKLKLDYSFKDNNLIIRVDNFNKIRKAMLEDERNLASCSEKVKFLNSQNRRVNEIIYYNMSGVAHNDRVYYDKNKNPKGNK